MTFGEYLKSLRVGNMSQRELAKRIGVSHPYISKIENDVEHPPSEEVLIKIAKELDIDADKLILAADKIPSEIKELITENKEISNILRCINGKKMDENKWNQIQNLIESGENVYKSLFYKSKDMMLLLNPKTLEIIDANISVSKFIEDKLKLKKNKITDIIQYKKEEIYEEIQKVRLGKKNYYEFKYILSKDEVRYLEVYTNPIKINKRELVFAIIHDITGRKKVEEELELHKKYLQLLFENLPEATVFVDKNLKVTNLNRSFENLFQYNSKEIKGKDIRECVYTDEMYQDSIPEYVLRTGNKITKENIKRKRKDGKLINITLICHPVRHKDEIVGIYVVYSKNKEVNS